MEIRAGVLWEKWFDRGNWRGVKLDVVLGHGLRSKDAIVDDTRGERNEEYRVGLSLLYLAWICRDHLKGISWSILINRLITNLFLVLSY